MRPKAWFSRKFGQQPDFVLPAIIERLAGTTLRLEHKIQHIHPSFYMQTISHQKWTIQEQVGHLLDLEPLWLGRVQDILSAEKDLREADLTNQKTFDAQHNEQSIQLLLANFRAERSKLLHALRQIQIEDLTKFALHPRLKTPMTVVDLAYFVAEHDDHHLAEISYWNNVLSKKIE